MRLADWFQRHFLRFERLQEALLLFRLSERQLKPTRSLVVDC